MYNANMAMMGMSVPQSYPATYDVSSMGQSAGSAYGAGYYDPSYGQQQVAGGGGNKSYTVTSLI